MIIRYLTLRSQLFAFREVHTHHGQGKAAKMKPLFSKRYPIHHHHRTIIITRPFTHSPLHHENYHHHFANFVEIESSPSPTSSPTTPSLWTKYTFDSDKGPPPTGFVRSPTSLTTLVPSHHQHHHHHHVANKHHDQIAVVEHRPTRQ